MKEGDKVKIVNYGHIAWFNKSQQYTETYKQITKGLKFIKEDENIAYYDMKPELVGKKGTVYTKTVTQGMNKYAIKLSDGNCISWFSDAQLELDEQE